MVDAKEAKGKSAKKKTKRCKKSSYYMIENGKLTRTKKICPKCGNGVFMGEHKDRFVCGSCRYTEMKKK